MQHSSFQKGSRQIGRRGFLGRVATGGAAGLLVTADPPTRANDTAKARGKAMPWKVDVTIYDRPGWSSTSYGLPVRKDKSGELVVGFQTQREDTVIDDFYSGHAEWVFLSSQNGGKSWKSTSRDGLPVDSRWPHRSHHCTHGWAVELGDGTLINVVEDAPTPAEAKAHLENLGLGHLWHPDSTFGWDLWPTSHTERLKKQGDFVFDHPGPHLPEGVVATHNRPIMTTISHDGGKTWEERPIEGLPRFARIGGWFRGSGTVLADGAVIGVISAGSVPASGHTSAYALRSEDKGLSWELIPIAHEPGGLSFNETDLLTLPSGRILAMIRGGAEASLYQSHSDDAGRTWSKPTPTAIQGQPGNLLRLKSGNILCVYRRRGYPEGYSGVLSHDDGKTWDVANEIQIRDDTLPGLTGYPSSVQLDDGTIFTIYNVLRIGPLKDKDKWGYKKDLLIRPPLHSYIAGSIYTEDFTSPPGVS